MSRRVKNTLIDCSSTAFANTIVSGEKKVYGITFTAPTTVTCSLTLRDGGATGTEVFKIQEHSQNIGNAITKHISFPNGILFENDIYVSASGFWRVNIQHDY